MSETKRTESSQHSPTGTVIALGLNTRVSKKLVHEAALAKLLWNSYGDSPWLHDLGVRRIGELPFCYIRYSATINSLFLFLRLPDKMLKLQYTIVKSPGNSRFAALCPALIKHARAFYKFLLIDTSIAV